MVMTRANGTIDIDGLVVFYETEGQGEPIVSHILPTEKPRLFNELMLEFTANPQLDTLMPLRGRPTR
jgi:hypothetical protein